MAEIGAQTTDLMQLRGWDLDSQSQAMDALSAQTRTLRHSSLWWRKRRVAVCFSSALTCLSRRANQHLDAESIALRSCTGRVTSAVMCVRATATSSTTSLEWITRLTADSSILTRKLLSYLGSKAARLPGSNQQDASAQRKCVLSWSGFVRLRRLAEQEPRASQSL